MSHHEDSDRANEFSFDTTNEIFQVIKTGRAPAPHSYLRPPPPGENQHRRRTASPKLLSRTRRINIEKEVLQDRNDTYVTPQVGAIASQFFALLRKAGLNNEEDNNNNEVGMESAFGLEENNRSPVPQSPGSSSISTGTKKRNLEHVNSTIRWVEGGVLNDELDRINYGKVYPQSAKCL